MLAFAYAKYVEGGAEFVGKIGIFVAFSMCPGLDWRAFDRKAVLGLGCLLLLSLIARTTSMMFVTMIY